MKQEELWGWRQGRKKKKRKCTSVRFFHFPGKDLLNSVVPYLKMAITSSLKKIQEGIFESQDLTCLVYASMHMKPQNIHSKGPFVEFIIKIKVQSLFSS